MATTGTPEESAPVIAQGRAEPMLGLADLPDPVDSPDASGPLSSEEEERWELCQRSFSQFRSAWWVFARGLDIALRGRLWRRDYATARDFIADVAGMSTSNAYRQIAGAGIAGILAGHPAFDSDSNEESRMRDSESEEEVRDFRPLEISQRAAEALTPLREDYGPRAAADAYRVVAQTTGRDTVSEKVIKGIVRQLPRRSDEDLDEQLLTRVRELASEETTSTSRRRKTAAPAPTRDPVDTFRIYVEAAEAFATQTKGMADAYAKAAEVDQVTAAELAQRLHDHMKRASENFPNV